MNDDQFWHNFAKNIKPLVIKERHKNLEKPVIENFFPHKNQISPIMTNNILRTIKKNNYDNLNKLTIKNFKKFQNNYFVLDLHGKTVENSMQLFETFIVKNFLQNNRNLLVITGKGEIINENYQGKIKNEILNWFNFPSINPLILTYSDAPKHLGGDGALIILLKKNS